MLLTHTDLYLFLPHQRGEFDLALEAYEKCETIRAEEMGYNSQPVADVILAHANVHSDIERGMLAVGASLSQLRRSDSTEQEEQAGALTFFKKGEKRML